MIKFGVFSDVHYAKGQLKINSDRFCDFSINKLNECINVFNDDKIDFIFNLGDIIHSLNDKKIDIQNIKRVSKMLGKYKGNIHNLIGNHDIESMSKMQFLDELSTENSSPHYSFNRDNWHFIILDLCFGKDGIEYTSGNYDWSDSFMPNSQKDWLISDLAHKTLENIIVLTHQNIDYRMDGDNLDPHVAKNAQEIREILEKSNKKIIVLQGHYHKGGHRVINGINYITCRAMCMGPTLDDNAFMIVTIDDDTGLINISGYSKQDSYTCQL